MIFDLRSFASVLAWNFDPGVIVKRIDSHAVLEKNKARRAEHKASARNAGEERYAPCAVRFACAHL